MELRLLGPLEVLVSGRLVEFGARQQRLVLALLALHPNEVVAADRLIDELWGETPPTTAAKSLQVQISRLRKVLAEEGSDRLLTRAPGYLLVLREGERDIDRFEQLIEQGRSYVAASEPARGLEALRSALALWRGPPLADFTYDSFALPEIARLEELRLTAVEERVDAELALGRHAALVGELERLTAENPLRERLRGQLMLALHRSGRQAEALEQYERGRRALADELGLSPGEILSRLHQAILRRDPALGPPHERAHALVPAAVARHGRPIALVGVLLLVAAALAAIVLRPWSGEEQSITLTGGSLAAIDVAHDRVDAQVHVGEAPSAIGYGRGSLWVSSTADGTLSRIDAKTRRAIGPTISLGTTPAGLAVTGNAVWIADADDAVLLRIDLRYRTIERIRLQSARTPAADVTFGAGSIWVALPYPGTVVRVDPSTRRIVKRVPVRGADVLAYGNGVLWVGGYDVSPTLTQIDARTNATAPTVPRLTNPISGMAVAADAVWVATPLDDTIWKVNARGFVERSVKVGASPQALSIADGEIWSANAGDGTLSQVNQETSEVRRLAVGNRPLAVLARGRDVWVGVATASSSGDLEGSGVLRIVTAFDPVTDPAISFDWDVAYATGAKLYNFPDAGGLIPRPELAAGQPTVSDDGRTYTMRIRGDYLFSPPSGARVTARTVKASIERSLSPILRSTTPAALFLENVVGAQAFTSGKARHIAGIQVRGGRLVIHLVHADGNLINRLALPYFAAVPIGTPVLASGLKTPIPSAGPYYVAAHAPGETLVLRRNPTYRGPRPRHFDEIAFRVGVSSEQGIGLVERGAADYVRLTTPDMFLPRYQPGGRYDHRFGADSSPSRRRYFLHPSLRLRAMFLNTSRPLFRDVSLRRAVNFALDRRALAQKFGALATDQYLPPAMPGFRDIRAYPLDLPDLRRAKLAAGPEHHRARLWTCAGVVCRAVGQIVKQNLARIGIDVTVEQFEDWDRRAAVRGAGFDIFDDVWLGDYSGSDPADIIGALLDGREIRSQGSTNFSYFDNAATNTRIRAAMQLRGSARYRAFTELDADLTTKQAPLAAFAVDNIAEFFSARVGCQRFQPAYASTSFAGLCLRR
jgi:DNA-binding SARP family transcriptional activator/ABC-type transport system substrate-binding protein